MSFGFSPSDIVALISITSKAYKGWKSACGEYSEITGSLDSLLIVLERIERESAKANSLLRRTDEDGEDVKDILSNSESTVRELHAIISRYKSLGSSREKNWDRLRLGVKDLEPLRAKLTQHMTAITAYLDTVGLGSLARIERDLNAIPERIQRTIDELAAEIRAGRREGSIMTTYSDDEKDVWKQFRRELIGEGLRSSTIHKYKPLVRRYLKELAEHGQLEELPPEDDTHISATTKDSVAMMESSIADLGSELDTGPRPNSPHRETDLSSNDGASTHEDALDSGAEVTLQETFPHDDPHPLRDESIEDIKDHSAFDTGLVNSTIETLGCASDNSLLDGERQLKKCQEVASDIAQITVGWAEVQVQSHGKDDIAAESKSQPYQAYVEDGDESYGGASTASLESQNLASEEHKEPGTFIVPTLVQAEKPSCLDAGQIHPATNESEIDSAVASSDEAVSVGTDTVHSSLLSEDPTQSSAENGWPSFLYSQPLSSYGPMLRSREEEYANESAPAKLKRSASMEAMTGETPGYFGSMPPWSMFLPDEPFGFIHNGAKGADLRPAHPRQYTNRLEPRVYSYPTASGVIPPPPSRSNPVAYADVRHDARETRAGAPFAYSHPETRSSKPIERAADRSRAVPSASRPYAEVFPRDRPFWGRRSGIPENDFDILEELRGLDKVHREGDDIVDFDREARLYAMHKVQAYLATFLDPPQNAFARELNLILSRDDLSRRQQGTTRG